jgi:hypothetical protein
MEKHITKARRFRLYFYLGSLKFKPRLPGRECKLFHIIRYLHDHTFMSRELRRGKFPLFHLTNMKLTYMHDRSPAVIVYEPDLDA